jgi:Flp pilus assembly protein TadG
MGMRRIIRTLKGRTEGSVAIITAIAIVAIAGLVSLAVDIGHLYASRNELQNSADAAALAAVGNLVHDYGAGVVRDATAAKNSAFTVAQRQSQLSGLPSVPNADRNDLTITFGVWDVKAGNPNTAWTAIGSTCSSDSNANAVKVTITRAAGTVYGPVTNFFAGILGFGTSQVSASAIAYLGYTDSTPPGTVRVPVAIPDTLLKVAKEGKSRWWASLPLLGAKKAMAAAPNTATFQDLGSGTFYQNNYQKPQFDIQKAYMFLVNPSDSVPSTVINNLNYNCTSGTPIRGIVRCTRLYPLSEYQWSTNIKAIFQAFQCAYNAMKDSNGKWRVTVPVYSPTNPCLAQRLLKGLDYLAGLLTPVPPAYACFEFWTQTYPGGNVPIYVSGFANVDITNVTYNSSCDDCSKYSPAKDGKKYTSTLDCVVNSSLSCRNANSVTISVPVDSTISPAGTPTGGPDNQTINSGAEANAGAIASIPRLVK